VLDLLGNLKVILEARSTIEPEEQELIMQLSPLYLEKIQAAELVGEQRGKAEGKAEGNTQGRVEEARGLVIRQLTRKLGAVGSPLLEKIQALPLDQLELLGEDLLDFTSINNLEQWLA
jgi:predicted transposase YdaD